MDIYMLVTPGTANQTLELNEIFYMCQAKYILKSIQDLGLCNHGPRLQNLTCLVHVKYNNSSKDDKNSKVEHKILS